ncbi:hypothetical protein EXIGLDRAFT_587808, partial [Exidia glandulosa HHB12029]
FPKSDKASVKKPPSPCKCCGGELHWDKECPHWPLYELRTRQGVMYAGVRSPAEETLYGHAYDFRLNQMSRSSYEPKAKQALSVSARTRSPAPQVEDVEDEFHAWYRSTPKAEMYLHEDIGATDPAKSAYVDGANSRVHLAGPPPSDEVFRVIPRRSVAAGYASYGVSVLSGRGRVGSLLDRATNLLFDSGASISLISERFLKSLKCPPKLRQGMRIEITQLTSDAPSISGYVVVPIYIQGEDGVWIEFRAELYVIPSMTVDVLLGEDFMLLHELNVLRSLDEGTKVLVGMTGKTFKATSLSKDTEAARVDKPAMRSYRQALHSGALRAFADVLIPAETTVTVPIAGDLQQGREWFVERHLIPNLDDSFLVVPNALLSTCTSATSSQADAGDIARTCFVQVSNPTTIPRMLRTGTLVGYAKDPSKLLDKPKDEEELAQMENAARTLAALV